MALKNIFAVALLKKLTPKPQCSAPIAHYCDSCEESHENQEEKGSEICETERPPEAQIIHIESPEEIRARMMQRCKIIIREPDNYALTSGIPLDITCGRRARIFQPPKNAQQQGTRNLGHWLIDFGTKERWENPLMGWCSSADPLSNLQVRFGTKEEAIDYCKKNNRSFWVQESKTDKKFKVKSYGVNFHHSRRTRVSTK